MPDSEYDKCYRELQDLETLHPYLITPDSPTQRVSGVATNAFNSITHRQAMLSLNNAFEDQEVEAFDKRIREAPVSYTHLYHFSNLNKLNQTHYNVKKLYSMIAR